MYKMLLNTDGADKFLKRLRDIVIEKCMRDASKLRISAIKNRLK